MTASIFRRIAAFAFAVTACGFALLLPVTASADAQPSLQSSSVTISISHSDLTSVQSTDDGFHW